ncbi:MAG: hypothetical protein PHP88_01255 [bacterium]|nr:hypothetical protein [bacterium]
MQRGSFQFDATVEGSIVDNDGNVEALRWLWLDRTMISGDDLGPGDPGDFDNGAWHVACHLVAAGGVRRSSDGRFLWLELSHDPGQDEYFASVTTDTGGQLRTVRLDSPEGKALLQGSTLLGFVEGNSVGRISARGVKDPPDRFNGWTRAQFDRPAESSDEGGKVWEHWCTVRDIRPPHRIGSSVIKGYVALVAALGDRFLPAVTRGRRSYGHPKQLCAFVRAGLTSEESSTWETKPFAVPPKAEQLLLEARPADALAAVSLLSWADVPRYYMFPRRISSFSPAEAVKQDLLAFGR